MTHYVFRPSIEITRILIVLLGLGATLDAVAVVSTYFQWDLLAQVSQGVEFPQEILEGNDARQQMIGFVQIGLYLLTSVFFCIWTYRMCVNAHSVGGWNKPDSSPGWAVGYYFIPIANLFKPYQALKQTYIALATAGKAVIRNQLFPAWWTLWIVNGLSGRLIWTLSRNAQSVDDYMNLSVWIIVVDVVSVVLTVVTFMLVQTVSAAYQPTSGLDQPLRAETT